MTKKTLIPNIKSDYKPNTSEKITEPVSNTPQKDELIKSFKLWIKEHKNFVTPQILKIKNIGNYFMEFSYGEGFLSDNKIYGITIIQFKNNTFTTQHDLKQESKCFEDKRLANDYFYKMVFEISQEVLK
jgi:hypothetical protein